MNSTPEAARLTVSTLIAVLGVTVLFTGACGQSPISSVEAIPEHAVRIAPHEVDTLLTEFYSGMGPARLVLRREWEWADFWRSVHSGRSGFPPRPAVDFEESLVIAASMGGHVTGGYSIGVERVYRTDDTLYVVVRETSPGRSCLLTQAATTPVTAVRVPWTGPEVAFVERDSVHHCD